MPYQKIGLDATFNTSNFQAGLSRYQSGLAQSSQATMMAAGIMTNTMGAAGTTLSNIFGAVLTGNLLQVGRAMVDFTRFIWDNTTALAANAKGMIESAGSYDELRMVAQVLGQQAGYTQKYLEDMTTSLQKMGLRIDVASNLIGDFARYGLDMAKATDLVRVAQGSAIKAQEGTSQAITGIMHGILTYNVRMLRTYGIVIDNEVAQTKYAESIGKTADALTGYEKMQAALNATLEAGVSVAGLYDEAMKLPSKQMRTLADREIPMLTYAIGDVFQNAYLGVATSLRSVTQEMIKTFSAGGHLYPMMINLGATASIVVDAFSGLATKGLKGIEDFLYWTDLKINWLLNDASLWGSDFIGNFSQGIIDGVNYYLTAAINYIQGVLNYWFAPGSPPNIAPELDTWGAAAIGEWLKGFSGKDLIGNTLRDMRVAFSEGMLSGSFLSDLTISIGDYSMAVMKLVNAEFLYSVVAAQAANAQWRLTQAQVVSNAKSTEVTESIRTYNAALRQGVTPESLAPKLQGIKVAEHERDIADVVAARAKVDYDLARARLEVLHAEVAAHKDLADSLKKEKELSGAGGKEPGEGTLPVGGFDLSGFNKTVDDAVEKAKKLLLERFEGIRKGVVDSWNKIWTDIFGKEESMGVAGAGGTKSRAQNLFDKLFGGITAESIGTFLAPIGTAIGTFIGELSNKGGPVILKMQGFVTDMIMEFTNPITWTKVASFFTTAFGPFGKNMVDALNASLNDSKWWETFWINDENQYNQLKWALQATWEKMMIDLVAYFQAKGSAFNLTEFLFGNGLGGTVLPSSAAPIGPGSGGAAGTAPSASKPYVAPAAPAIKFTAEQARFGNLWMQKMYMAADPNPEGPAAQAWKASWEKTMSDPLSDTVNTEAFRKDLETKGMFVVGGIIRGLDKKQVDYDEALFRISAKPGEIFVRDWGLKSPAATFIPMGEKLVQGLVVGVNREKIQLTIALQQLADEAYTTTDKAFTAKPWEAIGTRIADGLAAGIQHSIQYITAAAIAAAKAAVAAARKELDEGSPSKVFMEIGRNTMVGFAMGINQMSNVPIRAASYAAAAVPMATTSIMHQTTSNINMNMGGVNVSSPMDLAVLENMITRVLRKAASK